MGYVTLAVDSLGPRGITNCGNTTPDDLAPDAYRALNFLVVIHRSIPARVAVLGFAYGGGVALMSVERGAMETNIAKQIPGRCRLLTHPAIDSRAP